MSIRAPHLHDCRLYECYFAERRGEPLDPPAAEHLADCDLCSDRYDDVTRFMTSLADRADDEIETLFPPERLRAQQRDIARRLEQIGHVARVLSFPGRFASRHMHTPASRTATRWVAATAAACLLIGAAAGRFYEQETRDAARLSRAAGHQPSAVTRPVRLAPVSIVATHGTAAPAVDADEYFMSDLESALDRPRTRELLAFDAMTPHVREIRDAAR